MKKYLLLAAGIIFIISLAYSWGFWGHKRINRTAVFTLPPGMIEFYKKNIDYITKHAVDADKRRYINPNEAVRHYIDIDHYGKNPFDSVPKYWKDAVKKYSEDTLKEYGILPWYVETMLFRLTEAFKKGNADTILYLSANIGHYIADAHVPLHTTENYNGQMTGQEGIHGFWEARLPELYGDKYNLFTGRAYYIKKPLLTIWNIVKTSHSALDSVLGFEKKLTEHFPQDKKYSLERKGKKTLKVYTEEFSWQYHEKLNGMVERRMRDAVLAVASFWYTAWVNAGQPDLPGIPKGMIADSLKQQKEDTVFVPVQQKIKSKKNHEDDDDEE